MAGPARKPYTRRIQPHPCLECGQITQRPKRCSSNCNDAARRRRNGKRTLEQQRADEYARTHRPCPECGQIFRITRHDNHSKGPQKFCSSACRHAEAHRSEALRRLIQSEKNTYQRWAWAAKRREHSRFAKPCAGCGIEIEGRYLKLCGQCADARQRITKRAARLAGKARLRAAKVETFDPIEVLERDGWRCHICGIKTPKRLRGTYADNAPELDHIVPLAAGGEHSLRNTACACRKCNIEKADKPLGQMRLVA